MMDPAGARHALVVCFGDWESLAGRTQALGNLAVELYARGLSTRDIEDTFTAAAGRLLLCEAVSGASARTVARFCCTSWPARRRIPRRCGRSSKTCAPVSSARS